MAPLDVGRLHGDALLQQEAEQGGDGGGQGQEQAELDGQGHGMKLVGGYSSPRRRMISSRSCRRLRRLTWASATRARSTPLSGTSGGTSSGCPSSSTATIVR